MWGRHATCRRPTGQPRQAPHAHGSEAKAAYGSTFDKGSYQTHAGQGTGILGAALGAVLALGAGILFEPLPVSLQIAAAHVLPRVGRKIPSRTARHVRGASSYLPKAAGLLSLNPRAVHTDERLRDFDRRLGDLFTRRAHASSEPEDHTNPENVESLVSTGEGERPSQALARQTKPLIQASFNGTMM